MFQPDTVILDLEEFFVELEQLRFRNRFEFRLRLGPETEPETIEVPPLLLQPYVENALWHGLMHKEGERKLAVEFKKINDQTFRCTVDDNGIGRKKSFDLKANQSKAKRHESKGLKISEDRLEILQKQGYHATLNIIDKPGDILETSGTTIIIELSLFLKN